jgi:hypothetical protein
MASIYLERNHVEHHQGRPMTHLNWIDERIARGAFVCPAQMRRFWNGILRNLKESLHETCKYF